MSKSCVWGNASISVADLCCIKRQVFHDMSNSLLIVSLYCRTDADSQG